MNVLQRTPRFCSPVCAARWPTAGDGDHRCGHGPCSWYAGCGCIAAATGPWPGRRPPACARQGGAARRRRRDRARPSSRRIRRPWPGRAAAHRRPRLPAAGAGPPARRATAGDPAPGHPARVPSPRHPAPARRRPALLTRAGFSGPGALHIYRALPGFLHGHILNSRNSPATPTRPTTCSASACTGCRPARSPCCAASPRPGRLRRPRRTRTRTRHPPGRAHNDTEFPWRSNSPRGPRPGVTGRTGPAGRFPHASQLLQQAESGQHPGNVRGLNVRIGSAAPIRAGNLGLGSAVIGSRPDLTRLALAAGVF
jgi:hypothetical protein